MRTKILSVITCIIFLCAIGPINASSVTTSENHITQKIDAFIAHGFAPGVVVAIPSSDTGKPTVIARGLASLELKVPMQESMIFRFGSLTKLVTAMRMKDYIASGKLSLDADIRNLIPELKDLTQSITIEQLLTHSSGLVNFFGMPEIIANVGKAWTREELLGLIAKYPLQFEPGTKQEYSNTGYYLLGLILEDRGQNLEKFIKGVVKTPLKIDLVSDTMVVPQKSSGYTMRSPHGVILPPFITSNLAFGSGDIQGSVEDMFRLISLWQDYDLVPEEFLANNGEKLKQKTTYAPYFESQWGFFEGMELYTFSNGRTLLGKGGMYPGYAAYYFYDPKTQKSLIIAVNQDATAKEFWDLVLDLL